MGGEQRMAGGVMQPSAVGMGKAPPFLQNCNTARPATYVKVDLLLLALLRPSHKPPPPPFQVPRRCLRRGR